MRDLFYLTVAQPRYDVSIVYGTVMRSGALLARILAHDAINVSHFPITSHGTSLF